VDRFVCGARFPAGWGWRARSDAMNADDSTATMNLPISGNGRIDPVGRERELNWLNTPPDPLCIASNDKAWDKDGNGIVDWKARMKNRSSARRHSRRTARLVKKDLLPVHGSMGQIRGPTSRWQRPARDRRRASTVIPTLRGLRFRGNHQRCRMKGGSETQFFYIEIRVA